MPNAPIDQTSPYLLQHAHNPVDWQPWGEAAFARARAQGKPVFLSIGYSTCHWCHVMERESFENDRVAEVMNRHFVNIKVDREERPDIDAIYMAFVQASTGQGGWPMSVWLTPEGKPVVGGTYFPPEDQGGRNRLHAAVQRGRAVVAGRPRKARHRCRQGDEASAERRREHGDLARLAGAESVR
jgi:uncharacterized protein YyaL (SSP411 family)